MGTRSGLIGTLYVSNTCYITSCILSVVFSCSYLSAETYGEESVSILQTASLWRSNVSAFIGPQVRMESGSIVS